MSNWRILEEEIHLFPHPNAERLELGKVGGYQVVVQKGLYEDGQRVVFVPEKSVLTGVLRDEYQQYLGGPNKDRVRSVWLRGELSCGIIIPQELVDRAKAGSDAEDLASALGVSKYEPPIPASLEGEVELIEGHWGTHDCEQLGVYAADLTEGEDVVVTEKLHGSQAVLCVHGDYVRVASKGLMAKGMCFKEDQLNSYRIAFNSEVVGLVRETFGKGSRVQVFAELVPCQGANWTYGEKSPTVFVYDVRVDGVSVPYDTLGPAWAAVWVPVVYRGPYSPSLRDLRQGTEEVSGGSLHIREGVVIRPYVDRRARDGTRLVLKAINPSYKETGEEIN